MSNPLSGGLAGVGLFGNLAGAITGAIGANYQGQAQANLYGYQAGVARQNAVLATQDANYAREAGEVEAQQSGMKTAQQVAETRTAMGAGNIDVNSGSAAAVQASEQEVGLQNQGIIRADAAKRAFGFDVRSAQETAQAGVYDFSAQTAKTTAELGVASSIIGGASGVSSKWLQGQSSGALPSWSQMGAGIQSMVG